MDENKKDENAVATGSKRTTPEAIQDILHRVDKLPPLDSSTEDQILGYDKNGLPHSSQD
ncbi:MAG: hypothetical protein WCC32_06375 [Terriglobales bacterium]